MLDHKHKFKPQHIESINKCILTINFLIDISKKKGGIRCPISLPDIMGNYYKLPKKLLRILINQIVDSNYDLIVAPKSSIKKTIDEVPEYFIITWGEDDEIF